MEIKEIIKKESSVRRIFLSIGIGWTILIICLSVWNINVLNRERSEVLLSQARSFFKLIVITRYWNTQHGGVYVPVTKETQPNPYLDVPERDVKTETGKLLTLVNPAFMTRQIAELASERNLVQFHITSLKPVRPANAAKPWEAHALTTFVSQNDEYYDWWKDEKESKHFFRYMAPLWTERPCLKCHAKQGYSEGQLRGGISITVPVDSFLVSLEGYQKLVVSIYFLIWLLGLSGTIAAFVMIRNEIFERENLISQLRKALSDVKILTGFIPICASCKSVRNDDGYWEQVEKYIRDRSDATFSHGICPECAKKLYPDMTENS